MRFLGVTGKAFDERNALMFDPNLFPPLNIHIWDFQCFILFNMYFKD